MQTFLPHALFSQTAIFLDNKRLNKQILEADVLIDLHEGRKDNSWKNHPAFKMWIGYTDALKLYRDILLYQWISRGKKSTRQFYGMSVEVNIPPFLYDDRVIISHRSNLMRKLPEHYGQFGWKDYGINGYYWPVTPKTKRSQYINSLWEEIVNEIS